MAVAQKQCQNPVLVNIQKNDRTVLSAMLSPQLIGLLFLDLIQNPINSRIPNSWSMWWQLMKGGVGIPKFFQKSGFGEEPGVCCSGILRDYGQLQAADRLVDAAATGPLFQACCHVLGTDVEFHLVGSSSRQTVSPTNSDLGIHVRRLPGSERADEPFTETDKVARNLETLQQVRGPVTVGDVAIKLVWRNIR